MLAAKLRDGLSNWLTSSDPPLPARYQVSIDFGRNPALALRAVPLYGVTALTRFDRA
jgi:hypothetical protein